MIVFVRVLCKTLECEWDSSQNDCTVVKCTLHPLSFGATKNIVTKSHYVTSNWMQFWALLRFSFLTGIGNACTFCGHFKKPKAKKPSDDKNHKLLHANFSNPRQKAMWNKQKLRPRGRDDENTAIVASRQTVCVFSLSMSISTRVLCCVTLLIG